MTIAERIKRIADKAKVSYNAVKLTIYSSYGNNVPTSDDIENKLNILEKQYGI